MKAIYLGKREDVRKVISEMRDVGLAPIIKHVPYSIDDARRAFNAGLKPSYNIFTTNFAVKLVFKSMPEYRDMLSRGVIAVDEEVAEALMKEGIPKISYGKDLKSILKGLDGEVVLWCSDRVEEGLERSIRSLGGRIFYVHGTGPDISSFDKITQMINEGTRFLIFSSIEEVEAWEELESRRGEIEGIWAVAIGRGVASAIQNYTNLKKVLLHEEGLGELPNTLNLLGIR